MLGHIVFDMGDQGFDIGIHPFSRVNKLMLFDFSFQRQKFPPSNSRFSVLNFSPVADDEVTAQRTRLFFLIIIAMSDETLDKEGRESVLSKVGLYDEVESPNQIGGGVTVNAVRYVVEPLVDRGLLVGINFYSTSDTE